MPSRKPPVAAAALLFALGAGCAPAEPERPNLMIVVLDTLRADRLGCYGYAAHTSPSIDAFAQQGIVFENVQSAAPWTAPSLITLMTSLYPSVHGIREFPSPGRMSEGITTLAEVLSERGYATAAFTEGGFAKGDFGLDQGFDVYPRHHGDDESNMSNLTDSSRLQGNLERAVGWLRERDAQPFFLFFQTYEVHGPFRAYEQFMPRFRADYDGPAEHARLRAAAESWTRDGSLRVEDCDLVLRHKHHCLFDGSWELADPLAFVQASTELDPRDDAARDRSLEEWIGAIYDADLAYADSLIAGLWQEIERLGLQEHTVVLLTSDHGEGLGQHGELGHGRTLNEEVLHVPLILHDPRRARAPARVPDLVRSVDVMPTLLELLGVHDAQLVLQGRSLVPLLDEARSPSIPAFSHARSFEAGADARYSIRTESWRLTVDYESGEQWLYDLERDAAETEDVSAARPEVLSNLRAALDRQRDVDAALQASLSAEVETSALSEDVLEELRALGYVEGDPRE